MDLLVLPLESAESGSSPPEGATVIVDRTDTSGPQLLNIVNIKDINTVWRMTPCFSSSPNQLSQTVAPSSGGCDGLMASRTRIVKLDDCDSEPGTGHLMTGNNRAATCFKSITETSGSQRAEAASALNGRSCRKQKKNSRHQHHLDVESGLKYSLIMTFLVIFTLFWPMAVSCAGKLHL